MTNRSSPFAVRAFAVFLPVIAVLPAQGQEPKSGARPRVGLALGGGSARGLAHIGVLRFLEEHRIPVDAIAGTSTGAFVGGAYATGRSAAEIQSMVSSEDWDLMLRPDLPYALKSIRRKEDDLQYPIKLELGLRRGFRLQSGLNSGHRMGLFLSRISFPYSTTESFDDLVIPFRSVATDLEAGETVVLDRGPLGSALRASMALPGTFDPVLRDGRLLSDGGILNNLPIDVVRGMGVDVVIAVNVSVPSKQRPDETIQAVANRAIRLMMHNLDLPRLEQADVVIVPDLEGVRATDFKDSEAIAARGYAAAQAQSDALLRYSIGADEWRTYKERLRQRRHPETGPVSFVEVKGTTDADAAQISRRIERDIATASDPETIDAHLDWLIGHGRYASAMYQRRVRGAQEGLGIDVREKSYAPPLLKFSLGVDNENKDLNLTVGSRVTYMDPFGPGSEWRVDTSNGSNLRWATELTKPLSGRGSMRRGAFLSPRAFYTRAAENFYVDEALSAVLNRQRAGGGVDLGWLFDRHTEIRAGYEAAQTWNQNRVGAPLVFSDGAEQQFQVRLDYDGQDRAYFPTSGMRFRTKATWWTEAPGASAGFGRAEGKVSFAWRMAPRHHATLSFEGGRGFGESAPTLYRFSLGGPSRVGSLPPNLLRAQHLLVGGLGYRMALAKLPNLVGDSLYFTALVEAGSVFDQWGDARVKSSVTGGLAADTFLGPVFIGASLGNGGAVRAYFLLGTSVR